MMNRARSLKNASQRALMNARILRTRALYTRILKNASQRVMMNARILRTRALYTRILKNASQRALMNVRARTFLTVCGLRLKKTHLNIADELD